MQVVTNSAADLVKAGEFLMEKRKVLFWSPCSPHLLDLKLANIGILLTHAEIVTKAKKITVFIYMHTWVLNLMKSIQNEESLQELQLPFLLPSFSP